MKRTRKGCIPENSAQAGKRQIHIPVSPGGTIPDGTMLPPASPLSRMLMLVTLTHETVLQSNTTNNTNRNNTIELP